MITKGPWRVSGSVIEYKDTMGKKYVNRLIAHGLSCADTDDMSKVERTPLIVEVSGFERSDKERDSNAQAIAAVPELIEALHFITRCLKMNGPVGTTAYIISDELMDNARQALAKAGVL